MPWVSAATFTVSLASIVVMIVLQGLSVIGVQQIDRVVEVVEETFKGICCFWFFSLHNCID